MLGQERALSCDSPAKIPNLSDDPVRSPALINIQRSPDGLILLKRKNGLTGNPLSVASRFPLSLNVLVLNKPSASLSSGHRIRGGVSPYRSHRNRVGRESYEFINTGRRPHVTTSLTQNAATAVLAIVNKPAFGIWVSVTRKRTASGPHLNIRICMTSDRETSQTQLL